MKIAVIGTGYVGLVTGTCLAHAGNQVTCIDIDVAKVTRMQSGEIPIYEPGLSELFKQSLEAKRLSITTELEKGIAGAEVIFLALPTPPGEDGSADLSAVLKVAEQLGQLLTNHVVIVDKSTVPVGTGEQVKQLIAAGSQTSFDVVSNPEFLREGLAVQDFMHPDRIVIGTDNEKARQIMNSLYEPFIEDPGQIVWMDIRSAELTKYAANSFLAMKVSFMNEIANVAEKLGADVEAIRLGIGPDKRIGKHFLNAGIGYGGSCFPKDVHALRFTAQAVGYDFKLLESIISVNTAQKLSIVHKVARYYDQDLHNKHFAVWGLAFKPDTDDIRDAPALDIIDSLLKQGARITAYDPEAIENAKKYFGDNHSLRYANSAIEATRDADALIIITEWEQFRAPNFEDLRANLKAPVIFDGRNIYSIEHMAHEAFYYNSVGRATVQQASQ